MAGRSMSRWASTDAASAPAPPPAGSTCSTPFSRSPNAPCKAKEIHHASNTQCPEAHTCTLHKLERAEQQASWTAQVRYWSRMPDAYVICSYTEHIVLLADTTHYRRHTCSARSMPIFMVPADDGQVPQAPCAMCILNSQRLPCAAACPASL